MAMGAAERALDTLIEEGTLTSRLGDMQHRAELYELIRYEDYAGFDSNIYTFNVER
jgi:methylisocitrate lyase